MNMNLQEITFRESIDINGGDEPGYALGYYVGEAFHLFGRVGVFLANAGAHS